MRRIHKRPQPLRRKAVVLVKKLKQENKRLPNHRPSSFLFCGMAFCSYVMALQHLFAQPQSLPSLNPQKALTQYACDIWTTKEGLPRGAVTAITQTPEGYLWLATASGLVRFDGVKFTSFNSENTAVFKNNVIRSVLAGSDSSLWVATEHSGLLRYKNGRFTALDSLASYAINALCEDRDGALWFWARDGLWRWRKNKLDPVALPSGLRAANVSALAADQQGNLWLSTNGAGIFQYSPERLQQWSTAEGLPDNGIRALWRDRTGVIWLGSSEHGLLRHQNGRILTYTTAMGLADNRVEDIYEDRAGTLWIATDAGLSRVRHGKIESLLNLPDTRLRALYEDREGSLWIGSYGGLFRLKDGIATTFSREEGLSHPRVRCVYEDRDGAIWIGTKQGLNRWKDARMTGYGAADGLPAESIRSLWQDYRGTLWVGTDNGLAREVNGKFVTVRMPPKLAGNEIRTIYEARTGGQTQAGVLWIGTATGEILKYENGAFALCHEAWGYQPTAMIRFIQQDRNERLWLGGAGGLWRFQEGKLTRWQTGTVHSNTMLTAGYADSEGTLWFGTIGSGLQRWQNGVMKSFTKRDGLCDQDVWAILEDDAGFLWMNSDQGIWKIRKQDFADYEAGRIGKIRCTAFGTADGMKTSECSAVGSPSAWKTNDGKLWFTTVNGAVMIDPTHLATNSLPPPVLIEEIWVDGQCLDLDVKQIAPQAKDKFAFHYTALSLRQPQKVKFRFKLEGYDSDWVEAGTRRIAYYTNLDPGDYRFRVMACNDDGLWNEAGASWSFTLAPHFYQTPWFAALGILALGLTIYGGYRWRMRHLESREQQLEMLVAERTAKLRESQMDLASSEARFKILFEHAPDAYFLCDLSGTILEVNRAAEEILGYAKAEIIGKAYSNMNLLSPPQLAKAAVLLEQHARGTPTGPEEFVLTRQDGRQVAVEVRTHVVEIQQKKLILGIVRDLTVRKQMEESLREQELLREILNSSPIPMSITRLSDSALLFANERLLAALGTSREKMPGLKALDFYANPADRQSLVAELLNTGRIASREVEIKNADGSSAWLLTSIQLITYRGELAKLSGFIDITERKELEKSLRESEARFRSTFDHALTGMARTSLTGRWLQVNPALCQMLGYSEGELLATDFAAVTHPEDLQKNRDLKRQALANGSAAYHLEKRYLHKQGHVVWAALNVAIVRDGQGQPLYFVSHIHDITARKQMENELQRLNEELEQRVIARTRELKANEQKFRAIVDHAADVIFIKDVEGRYLLINPAGAKILGTPVEAILGKNDIELFGSPIGEEIWKIDQSIMAAGRPYTYERRRVYAGEERTFLTTKVPYLSEEGKLLGLIGIAHDITERQLAQALNEELRQKNVRAAAIVEARENERHRIACELHDGLGQILTTIRFGIEALERYGTAEPEKIRLQITKLKDLLSLAINDNRRIAFDLMPSTLHDYGIAPALQRLCQQLAESSGVGITFCIDGRPPASGSLVHQRLDDFPNRGVNGAANFSKQIGIRESRGLYRITQEALSNVIKHANAKTAKVTLAFHNGTVRLTVEDDGKGFVLQESAASAGAKNGLGMITMRERAETLQGGLQIVSQPGQGTRVCVEVPLGRREA